MTIPSTVTLKINKMPKSMLIYSFPCGETNCYELADMEFELTTLDSEYKMPLCSKHTKMLGKDAGIDSL